MRPAGVLVAVTATSLASSLEPYRRKLNMNIAMNMSTEFGLDDRRYFHDKVQRRFCRGRLASYQLP